MNQWKQRLFLGGLLLFLWSMDSYIFWAFTGLFGLELYLAGIVLLVIELLMYWLFIERHNLLFVSFVFALFNMLAFVAWFYPIMMKALEIETVFSTSNFLIFSATLKAALILGAHYVFPKKKFSFISVSHKFFLVSLAIIFLVAAYITQNILRPQQEKNLAHLKRSSVLEIEKMSVQLKAFLVEQMKVIYSFSIFIEENSISLNESNLISCAEKVLKNNPEMHSLGIFFDLRGFPGKKYFAFEAVNKKIKQWSRGSYLQKKWYRYSLRKPEKKGIFTDVFIPDVRYINNEVQVFITRPLYVKGRFIGVIRALVPLKKINSIVRLGYRSQVFVLDQNSRYIFSPDTADVGRDFTSVHQDESFDFIYNIVIGKSDSGFFNKNKKLYWASAARISELGWKIFTLKDLSSLLAENRKSVLESFVVILVSVFMGALLLYLLNIAFRKNFRMISFIIGELNRGVLFTERRGKKRLRHRDELGQMLNFLENLIERLKEVLRQIYGNKADTKKIISRLVESSEHMREIQGEQTKSLKEELRIIKDLRGKIKDNESQVLKAEQGLDNYFLLAKENQVTMMETRDYMQEILKITHQIESIADIISEVVSQTNLLALNASVEAARAGTAGKGFAVVALEIRKLASETGESALYINELISGTLSKMDGAQERVELLEGDARKMVERLAEVRKHTRAMGKVFREQQKAVDLMNQFISQVYNSSLDINETVNSLQDISVNVDTLFGKTEKSMEFFQFSGGDASRSQEKA